MELHLHVFTKKHVFNSKFATDVQALAMTWNYTPGTYPKNKETNQENKTYWGEQWNPKAIQDERTEPQQKTLCKSIKGPTIDKSRHQNKELSATINSSIFQFSILNKK